MPLLFTLSHTLTYLAAALLLGYFKIWKQIMFVSLRLSLTTSMTLAFSPPSMWLWGMAVLGISAALYTLGWTYPFMKFVPMGGRLKLMASLIIDANIINVILNLLSRSVSPTLLLIPSSLPLSFALLPLIFFSAEGGGENDHHGTSE